MKATFKFFFLIIFSIPLCFVKFKDPHGGKKVIFSMFVDIFQNRIDILLYIIYLINSFFYNILIYLIIDKFSCAHSAISLIFENFGIFIINTAIKDIKCDYKFGIRLLMYILLIFTSLIFNEFLVIKICGLANNTKLFLDYKEKADLSSIEEIHHDNNLKEYLSEGSKEENIRIPFMTESINNIKLTELK